MHQLTAKDIDGKYQKKIFLQDYTKKPTIEGVKLTEIKNYIGEDGDFSELIRVSANGELEQFPEFQLRQMNRSELIPGSIKAWHLHFNQEDIWHIPPSDVLLVGLYDVRKDSSTKHMTMRLILGRGKAHLLYIPRGVAHGASNISQKNATILYFVNQQFSFENPDEHRLPWDILGEGFWNQVKG
jgi:dTDP-4-dehydrorhamnose 3,5-epimerase